MSRHTRQEDLLDLLYGEASQEDAATLRQAIADDDELAAQWERLQQNHQIVSAHVPPLSDAPVDVQDAILAAARKDAPSAAPRSPNGPPRRNTFWSNPKRNGVLGLALGAALVLIGAFFVFDLEQSEMLHQEAAAPEPMAMAAFEEDEPEHEGSIGEQTPAALAQVDDLEPEVDSELDLQPDVEPGVVDHRQAPPSVLERLARLDEPRTESSPSREPAPARARSRGLGSASSPSPSASPRSIPAAQPRGASRRAAPRPAARRPMSDTAGSAPSFDLEFDSASPAVEDDEDAEQAKEKDEKSPLEMAKKALDRGNTAAAKHYLQKALADKDLSDEDRQRAEGIRRNIFIRELDRENRPASIPPSPTF